MEKKANFIFCVSISIIISLALLSMVPIQAHAQSSKDFKTLKVGTTLPLNLGMGVETKKMLEVIVPKFNEAGGITIKGQRYNIDLIIYDDKYSAEAGRAAVERLIHQDKVKYIICQIGSAPIVAGMTISEQEKVLVMAGGASERIVAPRNRYTFGTSTTRTSIPPLWMMARKLYPNAKTVVFLSPDDETGKARAKEEKQVAEAFGVKVLDVLFYPRDTVDFSSIAAKVKSMNADLVAYPGASAGTQFGLQLKALHAAGFKGGQISGITPQIEEIKSVASNEAIEGLLCKMPETELPSPPPLARAIKQDYTNKYGKWSDASLSWIPGWYAFVASLKKADSTDPEVISSVIAEKGLDWEMPNGKFTLVKRPDLKNTRYADTCAEQIYGKFVSGKLTYVGKLSLEEVIGSCEKVFGGKWK